MTKFKLRAPFKPTGDQPDAINKLVKNLNAGAKHQVLLGVTGSGKTFTVANVIAKAQKPTLVISHNKTLAAQLYQEFKEFFPDNSVSYFVSYYDYYQPEAYIAQTDTYIEKDAKINEELDRLRHSATQSLLTRNDTIVVASVSCIYNIGSPQEYGELSVEVKRGQEVSRQAFLRQLSSLQYARSDIDFKRGTYRVRGNIVEIWLATGESTIKIEFNAHQIARLGSRRLTSLKDIFAGRDEEIKSARIYPAKFWVSPQTKINLAIANIQQELDRQLKKLKKEGRLLEAERLSRRTNYDLEMLKEVGYCHGVENYSGHLELRPPGTAPFTLLDYFAATSESQGVRYSKPKLSDTFLTIIDESHMTIPQIGAMYEGDRSRKQTLIDFGFRLPSALDNRPLRFPEFEEKTNQIIYTSATPGKYELGKAQIVNRQSPKANPPAPPFTRGANADAHASQNSLFSAPPTQEPLLSAPLTQRGVGGLENNKENTLIVQQLIRPTGLLDPQIDVRPSQNQIPDLIKEIKKRVAKKQRVLVTTLTKRMAEDLAEFLAEEKIKTAYLHSEIKTLERPEILKKLRQGEFDVLVGINLLREGLDLPEVSLVAILDADKEGFLRNDTTLIQTIGRASRHLEGQAILYADKLTDSMKRAIDETNRRRQYQENYNKKHKIPPQAITKALRASIVEIVTEPKKKEGLEDKNYLKEYIRELQFKMDLANRNLQFDEAIKLKEEINKLKGLAKK